MNITNVKVRKIFEEGPMKAVVSVTFDDCFAIHDIKVVEANSKQFVVMPGTKTPEGIFKDVAHPTNAAFRKELSEAVIEAYEVKKATIG